jgi:hypothetical protein
VRQWLLNVWRMCLGLVEVPAKVRRSRERAQLRFEQLEDRTVPATFLVRDILGGSYGSSPTEFVNVNGTLFFGPTMAPRLRTLEERWHVHRHRAGRGHPAGPG